MYYISSMKTAKEIKQKEIERVVKRAVLRGQNSVKLSLGEVNHFNEDIEIWNGQLPFCTLKDADFLTLDGYKIKEVFCFSEEEKNEIIKKSKEKRFDSILRFPWLVNLGNKLSSGFNPVVVEVSW